MGVPVVLVNDLEAVAAALPHLADDDLTTLGTVAPVRPERRTMLAVNVGTGFGAASVDLARRPLVHLPERSPGT